MKNETENFHDFTAVNLSKKRKKNLLLPHLFVRLFKNYII